MCSFIKKTLESSLLVSKAGQGMYALKILKSNGLADRVLNTVSQATLLSPMTYASVAWWGFANSEDRARLQSSLNRAHRWGLFDSALPQISVTSVIRLTANFSQKFVVPPIISCIACCLYSGRHTTTSVHDPIIMLHH